MILLYFNFGSTIVSLERMKLELSYFVHIYAIASVSQTTPKWTFVKLVAYLHICIFAYFLKCHRTPL